MTRLTARRGWLVPLCLTLLLGGLVLPMVPVGANTLQVTNCTDSGVSGDGSLRGEIAAAGVGDTIVFDQNCTITLTTGTLTLTQNVTIDGSGHAVIVDGGCTLSGGVCTSGGVTVFEVNRAVVTFNALTIQHGNGTYGGGIYNLLGTLMVTNSAFSSNRATFGGGIYSDQSTLTVTNSTFSGNRAQDGGGIDTIFGGTMTVTNSTFSGNSASQYGGGIDTNGGTATVTKSTFTGNSAGASHGGGVYNSSGTLTVTNSTLSGNSASQWGGGIASTARPAMLTVTNSTLSGNNADEGGGIFNDSYSTLTVTNSTVSGNTAGLDGGGIVTGVGYGGPTTVTNTIVAGNTAFEFPPSPDLSGAITSGGHNLFGDTRGGSGYVASDLQNVNPHLGTLGNNGGPTQTILLLQGSSAIDAGDDAVCALTGPGKVNSVDQRGITRPVGAHCDIGAYETGVINPLPGPKPPGSAGGMPNPLPGARPAGAPGGVPNPLPDRRP